MWGCSLRHVWGCSLRHVGAPRRGLTPPVGAAAPWGCRHVGLQPAMWGCSLRHVGLQPAPCGVAACASYGCSLHHARLQLAGTHRHVRGARCARHRSRSRSAWAAPATRFMTTPASVDVRVEGAVAVHHGRRPSGRAPSSRARGAQAPPSHLATCGAGARAGSGPARARARAPPRARARPALSSPRQSGRRGRHAAPCSPRSRQCPRHCRRPRRGRR